MTITRLEFESVGQLVNDIVGGEGVFGPIRDDIVARLAQFKSSHKSVVQSSSVAAVIYDRRERSLPDQISDLERRVRALEDRT